MERPIATGEDHARGFEALVSMYRALGRMALRYLRELLRRDVNAPAGARRIP
jgi:hypothetical protein